MLSSSLRKISDHCDYHSESLCISGITKKVHNATSSFFAPMTASFDADALWDLYDDSDATIRGHVVPEDNGNDYIGTSHISSTSRASPSSPSCDPDEHDNATLIQTVTIRPGLSLPLHVPRSLLEDGCLGEVGGMVWDCSVVTARYLLLSAPSSLRVHVSDDDAADVIACDDFHIDLTSYDHIVELGSGLGLLGFALHRHLCEQSSESGSSSGSSSGHRTQKITLTDYLPELVDAMRRTAAGEIDSMGQIGVGSGIGACSGDSSSGPSPDRDADATESQTPTSSSLLPSSATNPSLGVSHLDWSDPSDVALNRCRIQSGESVLIVASEVLYEPCHADMLTNCIGRILDRSDCRDKCRVLVANFAERPGWRRFVDVTLGVKSQGQVDGSAELPKENCREASASSSAAIRRQVREMDLGSGGYELLDTSGDEWCASCVSSSTTKSHRVVQTLEGAAR